MATTMTSTTYPERPATHYPCTHISANPSRPLASPWSMESLLYPVSPEQFCTEYWGRRPLHIKGRGVEFYKGLITLAGLERYLSLDEFFERHQSATPSRDAESPGKPPTSI